MPTFRERFQKRRSANAKQLTELTKAQTAILLGHPDYRDLPFGVLEEGQNVIFIIDIRGFTKIAIAHNNADAFGVVSAITDATLHSVDEYGGFIGEFTGDGVMAYFGVKASDHDSAIFAALRAAAGLISDIKQTVSEEIEQEYGPVVRVGIGVESGTVLWGRVGVPGANDVKPISEVSFIAGKNSAHASRHGQSWQVLLGKNIARAVPDEYLEPFEPYAFDYKGKRYSYPRSLLKWREFERDYCNNEGAMKARIFKQLSPAPVQPVVRRTPNQDIREPRPFA